MTPTQQQQTQRVMKKEVLENNIALALHHPLVLYRVDALEQNGHRQRVHRYGAASVLVGQLVRGDHCTRAPALFERNDLNGTLPEWVTEDWAKNYGLEQKHLLWTATIYATTLDNAQMIGDFLSQMNSYSVIGIEGIAYNLSRKTRAKEEKHDKSYVYSGKELWSRLHRLESSPENSQRGIEPSFNGYAFSQYDMNKHSGSDKDCLAKPYLLTVWFPQ